MKEHRANNVATNALSQGDLGNRAAEAQAELRHTARIRALNDKFRATFIGGTVVLTAGIIDLGAACQRLILQEVQSFSSFEEANDPYREHDFGCVMIEGHKIFWKIDYYDHSLTCGSEDPADQTATHRVLTVMLANEY